jgi:hypothetical protein
MFLQLVCMRVTAMLENAGIRSTPLKGASLAEAVYGDAGRRLSADIDLLVSSEQIALAVEIVRELGYGAPTDHVNESGLPVLHYTLVHDKDELPPVEIHWRIHWYERHFAYERLLPAPGAHADWRPDPADELAALLLFYARDGFIDMRLAADLGAWWDTFGARLKRGALSELVRAYPALARPLRVALLVGRRVVGLPVAEIAGDLPRPDVRERIAARLANPNPHTSQSQLYADKGLIDGLLMPPGGFRAFVRRQVLPPHEVLDEHARRAHRRRARSSLERSVGVLGRYGLTLARAALPRETVQEVPPRSSRPA